MGYSDVRRVELAGAGAALTTAGDLLVVGFKRPAIILGWGLITTGAFTLGSGGNRATLKLRFSDGGAAYTDKDTIALAAYNDGLGKAMERSELLRGLAPASPNAVLAAFDVDEGDLVAVNVSTAEVPGTGGTAGKYVPYLLVVPKGSP